MLKVLFLIKSHKTPSSRIRIKNLLPYLSEKGIEADVKSLHGNFLANLKLFCDASEYDVTVLQKKLLPLPKLKILRLFAKRLVFDFDDAVYYKNMSCSLNQDDYISKTRWKKFKNSVLLSDSVIAANNELANKTSIIAPHKDIIIIPSAVPVERLPVKNNYELSDPPVLGWVGSQSTLRYLDYIAEQLRKLSISEQFILHIISDKKYTIEGVQCKFTQWSIDRQDNLIPKFDIGIMPLSDDPFSRGKAAYKLLQYMAAGVPSVASSVGMNKDVSQNNKACILAETQDDFADKIKLLLKNKNLRIKIGTYGKQVVEEKYSCKVIAEKLTHFLEKEKNYASKNMRN